jgi:prevent-host-death family protein
MTTTSLTNAKAHLSALVNQAASGQPVRITRCSKPVVQITAIETPRKPIDLAALRALTDAMPPQPVPAHDSMRQIRDEDRY